MRSMLTVVLLLLAAGAAPSQHTLILHVRYNRYALPAADTLHLLLVPRGPYAAGFVDASNPVVSVAIPVDGTVVGGVPTSNPSMIRHALVAAVNASGTGCTAVANLPDVLTITSPMPLRLAVRTDADLVGPTPDSALLVAFGNGVGGVADGILNNTASCVNQSDSFPFPYTGGGYCFIEHASTILYGEGNGRDLVLESAIGSGSFDQDDKDLSISAPDSFTIRVDSPLGTLDNASLFVVACLTDRFVSHFIPLQPELDVFGFHNASLLAVGANVGILPGSPLVGDGWQLTVNLVPSLAVLAGMSVIYQALCPDSGSANGLLAITGHIRHNLLP